ncbi:MAG: cation diffusion facilitator family transporter [Candidatus Heimdallarchaeota archaeon]
MNQAQKSGDKHTQFDLWTEYRSIERRKLLLSFLITFSVMFVEIIGAFVTSSVALLSDAGHMFTHVFAIGISLFAVFIAQTPPCCHRTYGLSRAEVLAAFVNGLFLIVIVIVIVFEAILRFLSPVAILATEMFLIAILGLIVNLASIIILGRIKQDLNLKGLFYHMVADASSSIGIIVVAAVIYFTGWNFLDPLISLLISFIILHWAWSILRDSGRILLEMGPREQNSETIVQGLLSKFPSIQAIESIHYWTISPGDTVLTAHIQFPIPNPSDESILKYQTIISEINDHLEQYYKVKESTIQYSIG